MTRSKIEFATKFETISQSGKLIGFNPIPSSSSLVANISQQTSTSNFKWITRIYAIKLDSTGVQTIIK
jgi:hypothetical protein